MMFGFAGVLILSQQDFDEFEEENWEEEEAESVRRSMYLMAVSYTHLTLPTKA